MPNKHEVLRVSTPIRATKLLALLATVEPGDETIVRHHNGMLIVEDPEATLLADAGGE